MNGATLIGKFRHTLRHDGPVEVMRKAADFIYWKYVNYRDNVRFDNKYGIETSRNEKAYLEDLDSEHPDCAAGYMPSKWREFRHMLKHLPIRYEDYVFIDAGAGKGRALMFAERMGFQRIIGVELADHLVELAEQNIDRYRAATNTTADFELYCQDIATFDLPQDDLVVYLYNPFFGESMKIFIDKINELIRSTSRSVYVVYRNAVCEDMFDREPLLEKIVSHRSYSIYRADRT